MVGQVPFQQTQISWDPPRLFSDLTQFPYRRSLDRRPRIQSVDPVFIVQFLFGDLLNHVQELLCDEALQFAEGLLLKNDPYLFFFGRYALAENQLSNLFEQGLGWIRQVSLQFFLALVFSQLRKLAAWEFQEFPHLVVNICSARRGRQFLPSQQL